MFPCDTVDIVYSFILSGVQGLNIESHFHVCITYGIDTVFPPTWWRNTVLACKLNSLQEEVEIFCQRKHSTGTTVWCTTTRKEIRLFDNVIPTMLAGPYIINQAKFAKSDAYIPIHLYLVSHETLSVELLRILCEDIFCYLISKFFNQHFFFPSSLSTYHQCQSQESLHRLTCQQSGIIFLLLRVVLLSLQMTHNRHCHHVRMHI